MDILEAQDKHAKLIEAQAKAIATLREAVVPFRPGKMG